MTSQRKFKFTDLYRISNVNLDCLTETYNIGFYGHYMATWPDYQFLLEHPDGQIMGYVFGKAEGREENWHGHVTAVTVAPPYRRIGIARRLMSILEGVSEKQYNAFFVDLFVRVSNAVAVQMYSLMGYAIYRTILNYYTGPDGEDGYDMRKALPRDPDKRSMIPLSRPVTADELDDSSYL